MWLPTAAFKFQSLKNKTATPRSRELLWIIASGIAFFYLSFWNNQNCNRRLFVTAITLTNCFPRGTDSMSAYE